MNGAAYAGSPASLVKITPTGEPIGWIVIKPRIVKPMHYEVNPLDKGTAKEFLEAIGTGVVQVIVAVPAQALEF